MSTLQRPAPWGSLTAAARYYGRTERTIRRWADAGLVAHTRGKSGRIESVRLDPLHVHKREAAA